MSITPQQWNKIEQELGKVYLYGRVELLIDQVIIVLKKEFIEENKLGIMVYRDGFMSLKGCWPTDKDFSEKRVSVYQKHNQSVYPPKEKARLIKCFGVREATKLFDVDKVLVSYHPCFNTFNSLKRRYQKLQNIQLIRLGFTEQNT